MLTMQGFFAMLILVTFHKIMEIGLDLCVHCMYLFHSDDRLTTRKICFRISEMDITAVKGSINVRNKELNIFFAIHSSS